jgi:hypothetical protein
VLASEAKGVDDAPSVAVVQAVQISADSALALRRLGVDVADCVVPFVLAVSDTFVFGAVYLLEPSCPCVAYLSEPLSVAVPRQRREIVGWIRALADFGAATAHFAVDAVVHGGDGRLGAAVLPLISGASMIFKPIASPWLGLPPEVFSARGGKSLLRFVSHRYAVTHLFAVFGALWNSPARDRFVFPLGAFRLRRPSHSAERAADTTGSAWRYQLELDVGWAGAAFDRKVLEAVRQSAERCQRKELWEPLFVDGRIIVAFPNLRLTGWTVGLPNVPDLMRAWARLVVDTADRISDTGVVHPDLRPANILWRLVDGKLEICVIDWCDALFNGMPVPRDKREAWARDPRYPLSLDAEVASIAVNAEFGVLLSSYAVDCADLREDDAMCELPMFSEWAERRIG